MLAAEGEVSIEAALLCESSPKNLFYSYCIEDRSDEVVVDLKSRSTFEADCYTNNHLKLLFFKDCTHLLFLDADVAFTVDTIRKMLGAGRSRCTFNCLIFVL